MSRDNSLVSKIHPKNNGSFESGQWSSLLDGGFYWVARAFPLLHCSCPSGGPCIECTYRPFPSCCCCLLSHTVLLAIEAIVAPVLLLIFIISLLPLPQPNWLKIQQISPLQILISNRPISPAPEQILIFRHKM